MKSTELNLIPIFVAIYEEQSLSKAATRLEITQPAVSKALARLRDVYNEPLFHRSASGVEPTSFASDIYPALSAALKNYTSTLSASTEFEPSVSNRIFSLACMSVASYALIPELLKQIRQIAPNIGLEVHPLFTEDYESDLRLQRYDLIIDMPPDGHSNLKVDELFSEQLMVVCSENHPRISDSITSEQFLEEEHIVVSRWHSRGSLLKEQHIADITKRKIVCRAAGALEMLPLISGTEYIGILPHSTINAFADNYKVKAVPLPFDNSLHYLCAIYHPSRINDSAHIWLRKQLKHAAKTITS
ncbi:LysR family transcriptional regulator [Vibrio sp. SCSIO 43136]|uniref:LysR family transcriptional regulator n=1 Tax=Vibrio sp. SCSIO 43136 TaxID=2819101 RepID=UPI002074DDD0|nr:LysR family transcriptional regulator [Vibrio sp. SCSIO 43136]USD64267.1 LysR family transcriptional regulator [Vibrio sp. SCSIO 43136]